MKHRRNQYFRPRPSVRRSTTAKGSAPRPVVQPLEPRKLLSATPALIGAALDLNPGVSVTYNGNADAVGVYENYTVEGLLGMPSGPDGDYLVLSTAQAFDAVRTTDEFSRDFTLRARDLGEPGTADDFATVSFTLAVPTATYNQRLLIDFLYASDRGTDGGDFFDIFVNGINIADTNGARVEAGGQYVTNERDPDLAEDAPGFALSIGTEYSDLLTAAYTIPDGITSLDIIITIADSNDAELDAWALIDNLRFEETQVVYLDFDGANLGDFYLYGTNYVVSAFDYNDFGLGANFADVIQADLEGIFTGLDIVFTTTLPSSGDFMHVVVGGENRDTLSIQDLEATEYLRREFDDTEVTFTELFNYLQFRNANGTEAVYGLADRLDLGNANQADTTVVFAKQIARDGYEYSQLRDSLAHYIGRNLGLRAESNAFTNSVMAEDIAFRGSMFEDASHVYSGADWGDLEALGMTQNAQQVLRDNLGSAAGDIAVRNSWADAQARNQAYWTIAQPARGELYDARFTIIGDRNTRTVTTAVDVWEDEQILVTDFAGEDPRIIITAAGRAGKVHNYETIGSRNLGQFTAVIDDARFTQIGLWEVVGSGAFFQGSAQLFQTEAKADLVYYQNFEYLDDDGDKVKITLNSKTGLFAVAEGTQGLVITLAETDGARDTLKFSVTKKGGDGRATIAGIQGTGLKTLTADKIDLEGTGVDLVTLAKGKFGSILNGTDVNVRLDEKEKGDYSFAEITGDAYLVFGRETKKFSADSVTAGTLIFDELKKLDVKGNLAVQYLSVRDGQNAKISTKADLDGGTWDFWRELKDNDKPIKDSLKQLEVKGNVLNGWTLNAFANANSIKVKGNFDADVTAGALDKLDIKGNWTGTLKLTDDGTVFKRAAKQIKVKGLAQDLLFQAQLEVQKILIGAFENVNIYIGFAAAVTSGLPVDIGLMTNTEARVKQLKMTGVKGLDNEFINSIVSAGRFDSLDLRDVEGDNRGVAFGVSAIRIDKITFNTGTGKITQKKDNAFNDNDAGDDFFIGMIS